LAKYQASTRTTAESDEGWVLDDTKAAIVAERVDGVPRLSFRLVNTPGKGIMTLHAVTLLPAK